MTGPAVTDLPALEIGNPVDPFLQNRPAVAGAKCMFAVPGHDPSVTCKANPFPLHLKMAKGN